MFDYLVQQWNQGPIDLVGGAGVAFLLYVALGLAPLAGFIYLLYFLLTLPLRRNERARLFLDLLELGLKEGRTPEAAVVEAASSRDRALGARFHLLAAFLERGLRLGQALDQAPGGWRPSFKPCSGRANTWAMLARSCPRAAGC